MIVFTIRFIRPEEFISNFMGSLCKASPPQQSPWYLLVPQRSPFLSFFQKAQVVCNLLCHTLPALKGCSNIPVQSQAAGCQREKKSNWGLHSWDDHICNRRGRFPFFRVLIPVVLWCLSCHCEEILMPFFELELQDFSLSVLMFLLGFGLPYVQSRRY